MIEWYRYIVPPLSIVFFTISRSWLFIKLSLACTTQPYMTYWNRAHTYYINAHIPTFSSLGALGKTVRLFSRDAFFHAFAEHRDYCLYTLLADAPSCGTRLSISAPGYHIRECLWTSPFWSSSGPINLPCLELQPEHIVISEKTALEDLWLCGESTKEQAN